MSEPENMVLDNTKPVKFKFRGIRYLFSALGFLGFLVMYSVRSNFNVAIVAMVNNTAVYGHYNRSTSQECKPEPLPFNSNSSNLEIKKEGDFDWSPQLQGTLLGAFYYGYCFSQIPGGRLAEIFSGKYVFGIGVFASAFLALLIPTAARLHVGLLIALRALQGLAQGVAWPAINTMFGYWLPDSERSLLTSIVFSGIGIGTVVGMSASGVLCNSDIFGGWPSVFYIFGIIGCLWFALWCLFITDSPTNHPYMTDEELLYITSNQKIEQMSELPPIPWKKIMTSVPFWAVILTQTGQDWCFFIIMNDLPTFFATILHMDIEKNGFLSSFPELMACGVLLLVGFASDSAIRRGISVSFVRKFCNSVSTIAPAAAFVGVCIAGCNITWSVTLFMIAIITGIFDTSGYVLSPLDLSPEYAGTLIGIANTISNLTGFLVPLLVGALTDEYQTLHQWRIIFGITIALLILSCLVFNFFSSAEKQDWLPKSSQEVILSDGLKKFSHMEDCYKTFE